MQFAILFETKWLPRRDVEITDARELGDLPDAESEGTFFVDVVHNRFEERGLVWWKCSGDVTGTSDICNIKFMVFTIIADFCVRVLRFAGIKPSGTHLRPYLQPMLQKTAAVNF